VKTSIHLFLLFIVIFLFTISLNPNGASASQTKSILGQQIKEVKAQNTQINQNTDLETRREMAERLRIEIKNRVEEKRATQEAKLNEKRSSAIKVYFSRLSLRLTATIQRLEKLTLRIESRVEKIEEDNQEIDTSVIKEDIDKAKTLLDDANLKLAAAQENIDAVIASDDPKEAFSVIRQTIKDIKDDLVETHKILVHTIGNIRGLRVGQSDLNGNAEVVTSVSVSPSPSTSPSI